MQAGARRLALFHHDPLHQDSVLDEFGDHAARSGARLGLDEVLVAAEGMKVSLVSTGR